MAIFPYSFDREATAALWGVSMYTAEATLSELVTINLVEWSSGRYRLHDLTRLFSDHRLDEADRVALQKRYAEYYLGVLKSADELYVGGKDVQTGLRLFDTEWPHIRAAQSWVTARSDSDPGVPGLCRDFALSGARIVLLRLSVNHRIRWVEVGLKAARHLFDVRAQTFLLAHLGWALTLAGDTQRAMSLHEEALALARNAGDRQGEAENLACLGALYETIGRHDLARDLTEKALALARRSGDRRLEVRCLGNRGRILELCDEPQRSIETYEEVLIVSREIGDRTTEAMCLQSFGRTYAELGQMNRAIELIEQSIGIVREVGSCQHLLGSSLGELGVCHAKLGNRQYAKELLDQCIRIACELGYRNLKSDASWELGRIMQEEGDLARAAALMQKRVDYEREIGHTQAGEHAAHVQAILDQLEENE